MSLRRSHLCASCAERIKEYGQPAYTILALACSDYLAGKRCYFSHKDPKWKTVAQVVKFLEQKGYIVTTEITPTEIQIIPNGRTAFLLEYSENFCFCHLHKEEDDNA